MEPFLFEKDTVYDLEGLVDKVEIFLKPFWEELIETMIVNNVIEFAEKAIEIGQTHKFKSLASWGDHLRTHAITFNMSEIEITLERFPEFIDLLNNNQSEI